MINKDEFVKSVDELGYSIDYDMPNQTCFIVNNKGEALVLISYDYHFGRSYNLYPSFEKLGKYYQIKLDELIVETDFSFLISR
ncbi:hypothetical protein [Limosilactobacillus equigenerosi]|uniref:hypothetical protein n=2 Tax=Limosilactobacillus equigenerosi TaxID=417373 RepID=UPI0006CFAB5B|nr:hypothetical protein [Limosilactobacillus equigenerosi]